MRHYWLIYQIALSSIFRKRYDTHTHSINGPPQCGIYTLGQLSRMYVLIRLEKTNKNIRGYYFFSLIPFGDKVLSFLIQKISLSCLLLSSHLGLWSIMVTFSLPKDSWWPVDLRCLLSGRSGLQFASLLWPFKRLLSCCLISPMY